MNKPLIRLHYIWFKDNNTFFNQGINFSSKYNFSYDSVSGKLKVTDPLNEKYVDDFFGNSIDVTAIVGQNGVGKTSLLRFVLKFMLLSLDQSRGIRCLNLILNFLSTLQLTPQLVTPVKRRGKFFRLLRNC